MRFGERQERLQKLQTALWQYAATHEGQFPASDAAESIEPALWEMPGVAGMRFLYVSGLTAGDPARVLVYEPDVYGEGRFALRTDGKIAVLSSAELRQQLPEKRP